MASSMMRGSAWAQKYDTKLLGRPVRKDAAPPELLAESPELLQRLGVSKEDLGYTPARYENDRYVEAVFSPNEKAQKAVSGLSLEKVPYGREYFASVLRDSQGRIISMGDPVKISKGDQLAEMVVQAGIAMGTGGAAGAILGAMPATAGLSAATRGAIGSGLVNTAATGKISPNTVTNVLGNLVGLPAPLIGAINNPKNPIAGALGSLLPSGLASAGVSNPLANRMLSAIIGQALRRNPPGKG